MQMEYSLRNNSLYAFSMSRISSKGHFIEQVLLYTLRSVAFKVL